MPQPVPASPNVAALAKFGDYQVSHFTGLPEISIPIFEVKNGSLSIPITLSYHASAAGKVQVPLVTEVIRLPELVLYDHPGFKGAFARTNLSFNYVGDYWNDRISCLVVVSGVWRFYRDDYYKGPYWDLGPGYYESFFAEKGPDDVVSSFQAIALT